MIIKGEDFEITLEGNKFNLSFLTKVNEGKPNERSEMKPIAYGLSFDDVVRYIVAGRFINEQVELSVSEFVERYKQESKKLKESLTLKIEEDGTKINKRPDSSISKNNQD